MMPNSIPGLKLSTIAQAAKIACNTPSSVVTVRQGVEDILDIPPSIADTAQPNRDMPSATTLEFSDGDWEIWLSGQVAQDFVSKVKPLEVQGIEHEQIIEALGESFLSSIAAQVRELEKEPDSDTWNDGGGVMMTLEILFPTGRSRQTMDLHDDNSDGLEATQGITFTIQPVKAFSRKYLGEWGDEGAYNKASHVIGRKTMFGYVTRPDGKILVQEISGSAYLPHGEIGTILKYTDHFNNIVDIEGVNAGFATGSLGEIVSYMSNVRVTSYCYVTILQNNTDSPLQEGYSWMSREEFLSRPFPAESTFVDFASTRFVEEAIRMGVVAGDPIYDTINSLR